MTKRRCVGFAHTAGKCEKDAGCPHTPFWCAECNELRMAAIDRQFEILDARLSGSSGGESHE